MNLGSLFGRKSARAQGEKITLTIEGMHCASCAMSIDGELEDTPGVISATTNFAKGIVQLEFDPARVSVEKCREVVQGLGYELKV